MRGRLESLSGEKLAELRLVNVDGRGSYTFPLDTPSARPDVVIECPDHPARRSS